MTRKRQSVTNTPFDSALMKYVLERQQSFVPNLERILGGAFEKALEDDWKAPKASEPPKRQTRVYVGPGLRYPGSRL
jgi:hypothetical protein